VSVEVVEVGEGVAAGKTGVVVRTASAASAANAGAEVVAVVVVAAVVVLDALNPKRPRSRTTTRVQWWRRRLLQHLQNVQRLNHLRRRQPTPASPSGRK
jgi:hypothetical protein